MASNVRTLLLIICLGGVLIIYYNRFGEKMRPNLIETLKLKSTIPDENFKDKNLTIRYVISSPECKLLDLDPWDKSVQKYLAKPKPLSCSSLPPLTYVNQLDNFTYTLNIFKKNFKKYKITANQTVKCCYSLITRINQNSEHYNSSADERFQRTECKYFEDDFLLPSEAEFIFVKCSKYQEGKKIGKDIYKNMHTAIPMLPEVYKKIKLNEDKNKGGSRSELLNGNKKLYPQKVNVIILGIDSVSNLNVRRVMPLTVEYLKKNNWVHLSGYNKIGDNTFPNLMAVLSGHSMNYLNYWKKNSTKKMDDCPSLWKDFSEEGYVTLYAEDTPVISTFNFVRTGFVEKPTDYYMRPFMLAAHELLHQKVLNGLPVCTGPVLVLDHILNYAKMFYKAFNYISHFSLLWSNSLSHNALIAPKALDERIHNFLNEISKLGIYNNSLIFLLSDHGIKFGEIRETFLGYVEERHPFVFIWLPEWFKQKYPEKYANLLINQKRLTTPYDVHVTFKNILELVSNEMRDGAKDSSSSKEQMKSISAGCPKCKGLFEVQPLERSCSDASIDVTWCLCCKFVHLDVRDETTRQVATFIYEYIVNRTETLVKSSKVKKGLCSKWEFSRICRSQEVIERGTGKSTDNFLARFGRIQENAKKRIFVIVLELNPGNTKFEAMVRMHLENNNKNMTFLEYPKRMDGIYKTSKCVKNPNLKFYCYCKKQ